MPDALIPPTDGLLHELVQHWAEKTPHADFLIDGKNDYSYQQGLNAINIVASGLAAAGLKKGDRICVLTDPCSDFAISFFAAVSLGAIWLGLNPKYKPRELEYVIDDSKPTIILIESSLKDKDSAKTVRAIAEKSGISVFLMGTDAENGGLPESTTLLTASKICPADPAFIIYTSGTTGSPKGALIPHRAPRTVGLAMYRELGIRRPRVLNNFPCNHVAGVSEMTISAIAVGGCVVFQNRFNPEVSFELIKRHRVSVWAQIPTMFQLALDHESYAHGDLSSIEVIIIGGAAPSPDLVRKLKTVCPRITNSYGMTETVGGMTWSKTDGDEQSLIGTVGYPLDTFEMRIADNAGNELVTDEVGEVQFHGEYLFLEYWQRPEATQDTFTRDGWLRTGDLGKINVDGALVLTGRMKEMFKSGGYNVYPLEVEQVITQHNNVKEAVVVSIADEVFSEVGCAFVQFENGKELSETEIREHCTELLANYKIPKSWEFVTSYPTLPNGKIDKKALKEQRLRRTLRCFQKI